MATEMKASQFADRNEEETPNSSSFGRERESSKEGRSGEPGSVLNSIADGMTSIAGVLSKNSPEGGVIGQTVSSVAEGLQSGGEYIANKDMEQIGSDLTEVVRKYPMYSMWIGLGVGVLIGTGLSRR